VRWLKMENPWGQVYHSGDPDVMLVTQQLHWLQHVAEQIYLPKQKRTNVAKHSSNPLE